uniref:Uncharacterized protein n=1 Tax=Neolamprologus brichardi TaxID=32507 RepID=A0A3Q4H2I9_NEOBR
MQISLKFGIYAYRFFGNLELVLFLILQKKTYNKPTHIAQTEEPWSRLHDTATVSSTQRSILNYDSLDLQLNAVYDHHKNCFWSKNQILYQKETVSEDHRRTEEAGNGITMWVDKQRRSIRIISAQQRFQSGPLDSYKNKQAYNLNHADICLIYYSSISLLCRKIRNTVASFSFLEV